MTYVIHTYNDILPGKQLWFCLNLHLFIEINPALISAGGSEFVVWSSTFICTNAIIITFKTIVIFKTVIFKFIVVIFKIIVVTFQTIVVIFKPIIAIFEIIAVAFRSIVVTTRTVVVFQTIVIIYNFGVTISSTDDGFNRWNIFMDCRCWIDWMWWIDWRWWIYWMWCIYWRCRSGTSLIWPLPSWEPTGCLSVPNISASASMDRKVTPMGCSLISARNIKYLLICRTFFIQIQYFFYSFSQDSIQPLMIKMLCNQ